MISRLNLIQQSILSVKTHLLHGVRSKSENIHAIMAEFGLKPPASFNFEDGDPAAQWDAWKNQFLWFLKATKKGKEDEVVQVSVLITCLGIEGARIYDSSFLRIKQTNLKFNQCWVNLMAISDPKKVKPLRDLSLCRENRPWMKLLTNIC